MDGFFYTLGERKVKGCDLGVGKTDMRRGRSRPGRH